MKHLCGGWGPWWLTAGAVCLLLSGSAPAAQSPQPARQADRAKSDASTTALSRRVSDRMLVLQQEAERLASQSKTLIGELRQLEVERDLQVEKNARAEAEARAAAAALQTTTARLQDLERQRVSELPDLRAGLVELYKRRRGGVADALLSAQSLTDAGRAARTLAALARLTRDRAEAHRRTLDAVARERTAAAERSRQLRTAEAEARTARAAAERAVAARSGLLADVDHRRDLNAQLVGELQLAQRRLAEAVTNLKAGRGGDAVHVPITAFRGALDWPVTGKFSVRDAGATLRGRMPGGRSPGDATSGATAGTGTPAGPAPGVELTAAEGTAVRAIHPGTVTYAEPFEGYGTLVIVDHGGNTVSLYGYLGASLVQRDRHVEAGDELGTVGLAPAGPAALYFELRVDGRTVNPVQWLKQR